MYKILGADGREYGPVSLDQIKQWIAEGRVNAQTQVRLGESDVRKPLIQFPELAPLLPAAGMAGMPLPPPSYGGAPASYSGPKQSGLATASLILGILSFACSLFAAIPAVICGHIARSRAKESPQQYGGEGMAMAGLIMGYICIAFSIIIVPMALVLPAAANAKQRAQSVVCRTNMRLVGFAFKQWSVDNSDFPWNVSVTNGGTMELAMPGAEIIDPNPIHFEVLSNELARPKLLICPADSNHIAAVQFRKLKTANISYEVHVGTNVSPQNPKTVLMVCPIHGNVLTCDGMVRSKTTRTSSRRTIY